MHTFKGKTCTIHYNSDMSGEIVINTATNDYEEGTTINVKAEDILKFVAEHIRNNRMTDIEITKWQDFLR